MAVFAQGVHQRKTVIAVLGGGILGGGYGLEKPLIAYIGLFLLLFSAGQFIRYYSLNRR